MKQALHSSQIPVSVLDAMEALEEIVDFDFQYESALGEKKEVFDQNEAVRSLTAKWLKNQDEDTEVAIQEIFRVINRYLHSIIGKKKTRLEDAKIQEGVRDLMALVGDAARKIDQYTTLFHETKAHCATGTPEYQALRNFFWKHLEHRIDAEALSQKILTLAWQKIEKKKKGLEPKYRVVDLESGKKDEHYELFYLRKEDGSRFFSSALLRNMKLVNDFGDRLTPVSRNDLRQAFARWLDWFHHESAENILDITQNAVAYFFEKTHTFSRQETVSILNRAVISLMMAAKKENLLENSPRKSCQEYFEDFQGFLRKACRTKAYRKWKAYPPKEEDHFIHSVIQLVEEISCAFFLHMKGNQRLGPSLDQWIEHIREERSLEHVEVGKEYWNRMACDVAALEHFFLKYPNGPLDKTLTLFQENRLQEWDPLRQGNLPSVLFDLYLDQKRIVHSRFPAPVQQQKVNEATVVEEWRAMLNSFASSGIHHHLLINLQDKTTWYDHARTVALENSAEGLIPSPCTFVTLATETDFYHQRAPFNEESRADLFIEEFLEQIQDEQAGFSFPEPIKEEICTSFAPEVLKVIHQIFFQGRNALTPEHRRQFIDLFYLFVVLKCMDLVQPTSFSLTCKDGIDVGPCMSALLFSLLRGIEVPSAGEEEVSLLRQILFLPALLIRQRAPNHRRLQRMIGTLRRVEHVREEMGAEAYKTLLQEGFQVFFENPILRMEVSYYSG